MALTAGGALFKVRAVLAPAFALQVALLGAQQAPLHPSLAQIGIGVALLVLLAIVVALLATRAARRKREQELPPAALRAQPPAPREVVTAAPAPVELPAERIEREGRARAGLQEAEAALAAAQTALASEPTEAGRSARRAEVERLGREVAEARRKAEYEARKSAEAQERLRRRSEAEALEAERARASAEAARAQEEARRVEEERRRRLAEAEGGRTLAEGLARTRGGFMARLDALLGTGKALDEAALAELEEILFSADVGVRTATDLLERIRGRLARRELSDLSRVKAALREEIERILALGGDAQAEEGGHGGLPDLPAGSAPPQVVMVVGVNGTGKTTTIGKLAARARRAGKKVLLGAGDTFRAAAGEQLDVWADRAGAPIVRGKDGADPGAVLFEAVARGKSEGYHLVLCDTAGRLHTKAGLMDELKRLKRTLEKAHPGAPHEVLLVVDATTGQNAIAQARQFHESLGVSGFVLTKLDGTAKGGVIVGICDELKIPVRYVGVGEKIVDLRPFDPHEFVQALFDSP